MTDSDNKHATDDTVVSIHQPQQQQQQQQQSQSTHVVDRFKGKWKQQVGAAKIAWGTLTEDELLRTEGRLEKLAGLIQERYAITATEANDQIEKFIKKCGL